MATMKAALESLNERHMQYLEATYHLFNRRLIEERRLLMQSGSVFSDPWLEGTPTYQPGKKLSSLELPDPVKRLLLKFNEMGIEVYDPPYAHQAFALESFFSQSKDLLVATGTGSGKTEIFLHAILGHLALEAERKKSTGTRGFRALLLYPMNALVADQLSRMRRLLGNPDAANELSRRFGRRVQFGMYTSRTPYPGAYDVKKNRNRVQRIIDYYCGLQDDDPQLFKDLKERGRIPAKDLVAFRNKGGRPATTHYRTQPDDAELFTRQEMYEEVANNPHGGVPDILITNYAMLEYMLLRPIEQPLFHGTRQWLEEDPENKLLIVLDEAHLYRGAQGAEIAMLMRRLLQHLQIDRSRVRFILTSASLGSQDTAEQVGPEFAADLTAGKPSDFQVVTGARKELPEGGAATEVQAKSLAEALETTKEGVTPELAESLGWSTPSTGNWSSTEIMTALIDTPCFRLLYNEIAGRPKPLRTVAKKVFANVPDETAVKATISLMQLGSHAKDSDGQLLLPCRTHVFFRGLPRLYVCLNPECSKRRAAGDLPALLGRIYREPRLMCECGSRVLELMSHRTCGAAYLRGFRRKADRSRPSRFLWSDSDEVEGLDEIHLLLEPPRSDPDAKGSSLLQRTASEYLDIRTGHLFRTAPDDNSNRFIQVWVPEQPQTEKSPWSWTQCPACGIQESRIPRTEGRTYVMDLETKGEDPFANLAKTLFDGQPPDAKKEKFPNKGRKVLCFSDGRQKAARLARDLQRTVERDSFREAVIAALSTLGENAPLERLYSALLVYTSKHRIAFFDDSDVAIDDEGHGYRGSRTIFVDAQRDLRNIVENLELESAEEIPNDADAVEDLNERRPKQFNEALLRMLGDKHFSVYGATLAFAEPIPEVLEAIQEAAGINRELAEEIVLECIRSALKKRAYDKSIDDREREGSRGGWPRPHGEGLDQQELVPEHVAELLNGHVSSDQLAALTKALKRSARSAPRLFLPMQGRYVLNPAAVSLNVAIDKEWRRCEGCRMFTAWALMSRCPTCGGNLESVQEDDLHFEAKKAFLRVPSEAVWKGERIPLVIRSEEHSAQLSTKDYTDLFSKTEEYELLFQDIIPSGNAVEQPVDVLSCTTTMEVGIDIGSLTAVAMRTVPRRPENYQQRSGRAGRRGSPLSTIITFADNSPHASYHFEHPETLIDQPASDPIVYISNRKICERHVNASLLQRFFHRNLGPDGRPKGLEVNINVFGSLGKSHEFFAGDGEYSLPAFLGWIRQHVLESSASPALTSLSKMLPAELENVVQRPSPDWRNDFVKAQAQRFADGLSALKKRENWELEEAQEDDLLSTLLTAGLLPTFSFPIDLCIFSVREWSKTSYSVKTRYEMSEELRQALSEYVPGRQVVVDKRTYKPYGIHIPFALDPVNRAAQVDWEALEWLNSCDFCESILADRKNNLSEQGAECHVCKQGRIVSHRVFRPEGFAPKVDPHSSLALPDETREDLAPFATPAKFPVPLGPADAGSESAHPLTNGSVRKLMDQELLVVNYGPNEKGFDVCKDCGAVFATEAFKAPHARPYPKDKRVFRQAAGIKWPDQCSGQSITTTFGYPLQTDLATIRVALRDPLSFAIRERGFLSAGRSLAEALVLGATKALQIDTSELAGGYRELPPMQEDAAKGIRGYVEFFLFDTTPGGAGFAERVYERHEKVIEKTLSILRGCSCTFSCTDCLRTYENRIWHTMLDRFLAAEILEYAVTGKTPGIAPERATVMAGLVGDTIALMDKKIQVDTDSRGKFVSLNDARKELRFRSCLVDPKASHDSVEVSDYEVLRQLPQAAHRILSAVKNT